MAEMQEINLNLVISAQNLADEALSGVRSALESLSSLASSIFENVAVAGYAAVNSLEDDFRGLDRVIRESLQGAASHAFEPMAIAGSEAVKSLQADFERLRTEIENDMKEAADYVIKTFREMGREMGTATRIRIGGGGGGGKKGGLFSIEGQMNTLYAGMGLEAAGLPIMAFVKDAIKSYADFEQAVANVNTMLHYHGQQLDHLKQQLLDLSKVVPQGPKELAEGLYSVVGAGVDSAHALDVLKVAAEAAAAGQTDLDTASRTLITVMDSYGMKATDVKQISDILFAANQAGALTFRDLAASIGTVAGPAANAGVSFKEVAAATAALTNTGLSAQRATEGLRALIIGIQNPTAKAQEEAKKLGIEWDANALKARGLAGMIQLAMQATHGNAEELKKLIPNIAAYTAAVDLGGKGSQAFKNALDAVNNSAGATDQAMDAIKNSAQYNLQQFSKAWEDVKMTFAKDVLPAVIALMDKVKELFDWFGNLSPTTQKLVSYLVLGAGAFFTLGGAIFMTISNLGGVISGIMELAGDFPILQGAIDALLGPWGLLIGAIVTGAIAIISHWDQIVSWVKKNFGVDIPKVFNQLQGTVNKAMKDIGKAFDDVWKDIQKSFGDIGKVIDKEFGGSMKRMKQDIGAGVKELLKSWNDAWGGIKKTAVDVANALKKAWDDSWKKMKPDIINGVKEVHKWWDQTWPIMRKTFSDVWNAIKKAFQDAWSKVEPTIISGIKEVKKFWDQEWPTLKQIFEKVWNSLSKAFQDAWKNIGPALIKGIQEVQKFWDDVWPKLQKFFAPIWEKIKSDIKDGLDFINKHWDQIWGMISSTFKMVWDNLVGILSVLWDTFSGIIKVGLDILNGDWGQAWNDMKDMFSNIWNDIVNWAGNWISDAWNWGKNLISMLADGIYNAIPGLKDAVNAAANVIHNVLGFHSPTKEGPAHDSDTWAPNFMRMFAKGIEEHIDWVQRAVYHVAETLHDGLGFHQVIAKARSLARTQEFPERLVPAANPFLVPEADNAWDRIPGHSDIHPTVSYYDRRPGHTSHYTININVDGRSKKTDRDLAEHIVSLITRNIKTHR